MSDQSNVERSRTSPVVEIPALNKLKRKRAESAESGSPPPLAPQAKKQRPGSATPRPLLPAKPRLPAKTEAERTLTPAVPDVVAGAAQTDAGSPQSRSAPLGIEAPAVTVKTPPPDLLHYSPTIATAETMRSAANDAPEDVDMDAESSAKPDTAAEVPALSALQQTFENQFNMQILFKHNELRLIEQELAKCQVALEQLRRCEIKGYPGASGLSEEMSTGLGPAVLPPAGSTLPSHAAPYGVTDGPYTRHYNQWLIPDPVFDVAVESADPTNSASDRAARASLGSARKSTSSKPVVVEKPSRKSFSSLPNYRAEPSPGKLKLAIVNRQMDGKMVKLVCNNCHRFDFNSVQGFLNHCRIAHKVDYKSHEVAAVDCGSPLDEDELAQWRTQAAHQAQNVVTPVPRRSAPKKEKAATAARAASPSMTVSKESGIKPRAHPLNRSNGNVGPTSATPSRKPSVAQRPAAPVVTTEATTGQGQVPFKPAADTPYLSALFQKNNIGRDLAEATEKAKQKIVLSGDDDLASPDTASPISPAFHNAASNLAAPSTLSRPSSRKGYRQPPTLLPATAPRHRPSPLAPPTTTHDTHPSAPNSAEIPESPNHPFHRPSHSPTNLSPHTIDSAPGLVSDVDGEEDEEEEDDDARSTFSTEHPHPAQAAQSNFPTNGRGCAERMELGVVDEEMGLGGVGEDGIVVRRNSVVDGVGKGAKMGKGKR